MGNNSRIPSCALNSALWRLFVRVLHASRQSGVGLTALGELACWPEEGNTAGRSCCSSSMPPLPLRWCPSAGGGVLSGTRYQEGKEGLASSQEGLGSGAPSWRLWADIDSNTGHLFLAVA